GGVGLMGHLPEQAEGKVCQIWGNLVAGWVLLIMLGNICLLGILSQEAGEQAAHACQQQETL
ncbi:hypothetical protein NL476_28355, partial [Klebsiella pneumoniae]|nr:hypothetical protein [Klebsiella pneumoniae]